LHISVEQGLTAAHW